MRCSGNGSPASVAIAARCSTVLVEQPIVASRARAFSTALWVTMSRGFRSSASARITAIPLSLASRSRSEYGAGTVPLPGSARPSTSVRQFMLLAVNRPEQDPHVGQAAHSSALRPSSSSVPAMCRPTPSKTLFRSRALSPARPASMGPPLTTTVGILRRTAAISMPGTILSQQGTSTSASKACAMAMDSTVSAMSSRLGSE